jgi:hypothetical protein
LRNINEQRLFFVTKRILVCPPPGILRAVPLKSLKVVRDWFEGEDPPVVAAPSEERGVLTEVGPTIQDAVNPKPREDIEQVLSKGDPVGQRTPNNVGTAMSDGTFK